MTIEEILAGESKNVEFKENLPEKSIKYMKSVVAFANAVSDSCEPAIIPDITLRTVDGKTVIVAEISEGRQRPYYIKALGREGGVYVRVAGTTRLADEYMIKELMFEGSNRYFDQALCTGLTITDEDIDALCKAMKEQAVKSAHNEEQKASIKDVGRQQLRSWGVLIERDGKDYPSNAFAILTGNGGLHVSSLAVRLICVSIFIEVRLMTMLTGVVISMIPIVPIKCRIMLSKCRIVNQCH